VRRLTVEREQPDPFDYGMVPIAPEEPLSEYQRFVAWQREKRIMNEVYRLGLGVIRRP
jgi:hypothetical protein